MPLLLAIINLVEAQQSRVAQVLVIKLVLIGLIVPAGVHAKLNIPIDLWVQTELYQ